MLTVDVNRCVAPRSVMRVRHAARSTTSYSGHVDIEQIVRNIIVSKSAPLDLTRHATQSAVCPAGARSKQRAYRRTRVHCLLQQTEKNVGQDREREREKNVQESYMEAMTKGNEKLWFIMKQ